VLSSNPQAAMQLGQQLDASKMVEEMQRLRGDSNPSRFRYAPGTQPPPMAMQPPPGALVAPPPPKPATA